MIEIYTDGACSPNPGKGGYAYIVVEDDIIVANDGGYKPYTTNQVMELSGMLAACEYCRARGALSAFAPSNFTIYTDSAYIVNCITQKWYVGWQKNGWRNSKKQAVANRELWEALIPFFECPAITIKKVKGHSGVKYNEIVDQLAVSYRSEVV